MNNSILRFSEQGIPELQKVQETFLKDPTKIAEFIREGLKPFLQAALDYYGETFTAIDEQLRGSVLRKRQWDIVRRDEGSLLCSVGRIRYKKTLFRNKETGERVYLTDRTLGIKPHERLTEDALVKMLEEASESSYRKGGINTSLSEEVSKQTVMNKLRGLRFPEIEKQKGRRKQVEYLYIDADEDHVALQFLNKKGDLKKGKGHIVMPRLVYVYEGVEEEYPGSERHHLMGARYFGGVYEGAEGVKNLWKEVDSYIKNHYDLNCLKKVYIHGDGAQWIKSGRDYLPQAVFVLDRFHMHKYIIAATSHLLDSAEDARSEIYRSIHKRNKGKAGEVFERILQVTESESKRKAVQAGMDYILNNWSGIMESLKGKGHQTGCSAEGHISHIYADRMSSRPLGWSKEGADRMTRLRVYRKNGQDLLKLVRYQKEELPKAAGAEEEIIYRSNEIIASERSRWGDLGKYYSVLQGSIPYPQVKKKAWFQWKIFGI